MGVTDTSRPNLVRVLLVPLDGHLRLKVINSRKQILKLSFEPKKEQKYFFISALASKNGVNAVFGVNPEVWS